jgi:hypothetical protein
MTDFWLLFKTAAEAKGWTPIYGSREYEEYELHQADLSDGDVAFMMFPCRVRAQVDGGYWSRYTVETKLLLLSKTETTDGVDTISSVGETELQKYEARLQSLSTLLDDFLKDVLGCATNIEAQAVTYFRELNQFSESVDYVSADIQFLSW